MKDEEQSRNICEFRIHPNNFNVEINEVKPIYAYGCIPLVLDIKVKNCCKIKSSIKVKVNPCNGDLYFIEPSTLIYKAYKGFFGMDIFQLCFTDELGGESVDSIFVCVKKINKSYGYKLRK